MTAAPMPAAEVAVDEHLVRRLLRSQHPDLADRPLRLVASGWDNVVYRLGEDLAARVPRRAAAAELVANELAWVPALAARLPLPVPVPVRVGAPDAGYPFPWSVCRYLAGDVALRRPLGDHAAGAGALGGFVRAMAVPAPAEAPANPFRGVPLADRCDRFEEHLAAVADRVDAARARAAWDAALAAPPHDGPPVWLHGDLHPGNLVVDDGGRLAGVLDFGDLCAGDPATDLGVAWMLFDAPARARFRTAAGAVGDHEWARGRGWALAIGLAILANAADNPAYDALGERTVAAVLADG